MLRRARFAAPLAALTMVLGAMPATADSSISSCFDDATGDVVAAEAPNGSVAEPRADILDHCVGYNGRLSLFASVSSPTDPADDINWEGATSFIWQLDTNNDGDGDWAVSVHLDVDSNFVAVVEDMTDADLETEACRGTAIATSSGIHASGIEGSCIGNPTSLSASPLFLYDQRPGGGTQVVRDDAPGAGGFSGPVSSTNRIATRAAGEDRVATSIAISQRNFPTTAGVVYLANKTTLVDAVSGGILTGAPILLVPTCGAAPQIVLDEVARLKPTTVIALGGVNAICPELLSEVGQGRATGRFAGATRVETAVRISQAAYPVDGSADTVYLARQDIFADAVAGGVLTDGPILLVPTCGAVPDVVSDEIDRLDPDSVIALGGPSAICEPLLKAATPLGAVADRLAGESRYETAIAIARHVFPRTADTVYLARADVFADAVSGGAVLDGPILLVPSSGVLRDSVRVEISRLSPKTVVAFGGVNAISGGVLQQGQLS